MRKSHILSRFDKLPALVAPQHVQQMRAIPDDDDAAENFVFRQCAQGFGFDYDESNGKPFVYQDGVAFIPAYGILLHRFGWCCSYATGYDFIRAQLHAALSDPQVKGIVLDINSYGGQVAGNFELCDEIYAARAEKPICAVVDASAYSGGYSLASAANSVVVTPSGGVGSIGVVMMHVSYEKMLTEAGIAVTFIYAGEHKVDGNPYEDLGDDARERFQAGIDRTYEKFVALVARNRALDPDAVKATEALCYDAEEALPLGLIDAIQTPQGALVTFRNGLKGSVSPLNRGAKKMNIENENGGEQTVTQSAHDAAVANATKSATETAVKAERERVAAITSCDEAKGKEKLANTLATTTSLSVDEAKGILKAAASETVAAPAGGNAFAAAMDGGDNPNIGSDAAAAGGDGQPSRAARIAGNYAAVTGRKLEIVKK